MGLLDEVVEIPRKTMALFFLIDTSGSMSDCIDELRDGLKLFLRETSDDETASMSVELEVITREDKVDMDADNTSTITIPTKMSDNVDNMLGTMAS